MIVWSPNRDNIRGEAGLTVETWRNRQRRKRKEKVKLGKQNLCRLIVAAK